MDRKSIGKSFFSFFLYIFRISGVVIEERVVHSHLLLSVESQHSQCAEGGAHWEDVPELSVWRGHGGLQYARHAVRSPLEICEEVNSLRF